MAKVDAAHQGPSFWERLQPRERVYVMVLVGVFIFMGTSVMMFLRYKKLGGVDEEIVDLREGLDLTRTMGPSFKERQAKPADNKIPTEKLLFATLVENAQMVAEVTASNQEEKPALEVAPGIQKRTYEFDLRNVTLDQLTKFLATVEGQEDRVVLTENLTIRSPSSSEDRLNVNVVLATWERRESEEEEEG